MFETFIGSSVKLWIKCAGYNSANEKSLDQTIISLFLPEGMLDCFKITPVEKSEDSYNISLTEKNLHPEEYANQSLISKSYFEEIIVKDFSLSRKGYYNFLEQEKLARQQSERFLNTEQVYEQALKTLESVENLCK